MSYGLKQRMPRRDFFKEASKNSLQQNHFKPWSTHKNTKQNIVIAGYAEGVNAEQRYKTHGNQFYA